MKKLFLTLLLISPLAKSEILELTCESAFPFWVSVNLDSKEGTIKYADISADDGFLNGVKEFGGTTTKIRSFEIEGDHYAIYIGRLISKSGRYNLFINRRNLDFFIAFGAASKVTGGTCIKGIHELPEYQI
ncbi:hypothetical protein N9N99_01235 [Gammaproteobacteria bacterium]|nr:hypothetical protein [Gammaproteobacteria bacterium]